MERCRRYLLEKLHSFSKIYKSIYFFNKIDFELAKKCKEIGKKAKYIESNTKKNISYLPGYLFLNLTDSHERNFFNKTIKKSN